MIGKLQPGRILPGCKEEQSGCQNDYVEGFLVTRKG